MRTVRIREQKMDGEMRRDSRGIRSGRDKLRRREGARLLQLYQMLCEKKFLNVVITLNSLETSEKYRQSTNLHIKISLKLFIIHLKAVVVKYRRSRVE